jgi:hypothetical protein
MITVGGLPGTSGLPRAAMGTALRNGYLAIVRALPASINVDVISDEVIAEADVR